MKFSSRTLYLPLLLFVVCSSAQEDRFTRAQTCGAFVLYAGAAFGLAYKFKEAPFLTTTFGDCGTALGIYALERSWNAYRFGQRARAKDIATTCSYDAVVAIVPDILIPYMGSKLPWKRAAHWFAPTTPTASRWWVTAGTLLGVQSWHAYKDPIGTAKGLNRAVNDGTQQMRLAELIKLLDGTKRETVTVIFPQKKTAQDYCDTSKDPACVVDESIPEGTVSLTVTVAHAQPFFNQWNTQIQTKLKTTNNEILGVEIATNQIVSRTLAASGLMLPALQDMPLTRMALGFVAGQLLSAGREKARTTWFPRSQLTLPDYPPLFDFSSLAVTD